SRQLAGTTFDGPRARRLGEIHDGSGSPGARVKSELGRRTFLGGAVALTAGCHRGDSSSTSAPVPVTASSEQLVDGSRGAAAVEQKELNFPTTSFGPEKAIALVPSWGSAGERFPVLVALHGRGEAVRGVAVGARAWLFDYELGRTISRLRSPPLN